MTYSARGGVLSAHAAGVATVFSIFTALYCRRYRRRSIGRSCFVETVMVAGVARRRRYRADSVRQLNMLTV